ncbi:hypothetical protein JKF63_04324 [Porcisia hertigi]|uniref:Uncharacterized protein n=1 Tax=Porcisia hertigi TaxID=2761500 RepID=A0A836HLM4_9TRYP|nr:hypothetical protein JKF63_04324 [Porcisia hertigi]
MAEHTFTPESEAMLLQRLVERYYEAYKRDNGGETVPTVEASLMRMMAVMGEISCLAFTSSSEMSTFEKDEISVLVGKLSISVARIAEAFQLNVARSVLQYLEEELRAAAVSQRGVPGSDRTTKAPESEGFPGGVPSPAASTSIGHAQPPQPPPPVTDRELSVVLSPASIDAFFRHIDQLATSTPESFDKAGLKWVVPLPDGTLEELVPNGSRTKVRHEDFPHYLAHIARYREARASQSQSVPPPSDTTGVEGKQDSKNPTAASLPSGTGGASFATSSLPPMLAQAPSYDPDREWVLYSPDHFSGNLFSPLARASDVQSMKVAPPAAMEAAVENGGARYERRNRSHVQHIGRPYDVSSFHEKVNQLRRGLVPRAAIPQLGLTFSVPDGQRIVELINEGMQVDVTAANVGEFLRLLDNYPTAQPPSCRVHRTNSVRKFDVGPIIADVPAAFSPSHFSHGLFAPYQEPISSVYVDCDNLDQILPHYLKEHHVSPTDTRGLYVRAASSSDYATLERIVREVKMNPSALTKYGVTFGVPSSLEPLSTPEERHSGLHALFPSSAFRPVQPEDLPYFLSLVRQYYPNAL